MIGNNFSHMRKSIQSRRIVIITSLCTHEGLPPPYNQNTAASQKTLYPLGMCIATPYHKFLITELYRFSGLFYQLKLSQGMTTFILVILISSGTIGENVVVEVRRYRKSSCTVG